MFPSVSPMERHSEWEKVVLQREAQCIYHKSARWWLEMLRPHSGETKTTDVLRVYQHRATGVHTSPSPEMAGAHFHITLLSFTC